MTPDNINTIFVALITGAVTAIGSSLLTIAGLRVQIGYIEKAIERLDKGLSRAHERIDELNQDMR